MCQLPTVVGGRLHARHGRMHARRSLHHVLQQLGRNERQARQRRPLLARWRPLLARWCITYTDTIKHTTTQAGSHNIFQAQKS